MSLKFRSCMLGAALVLAGLFPGCGEDNQRTASSGAHLSPTVGGQAPGKPSRSGQPSAASSAPANYPKPNK
jgi:hypothetical protein